MRSIESTRAACRARELAVAPIEALDLWRQRLARTRIVDDVIGSRQPVSPRQLGRHDLAHIVGGKSAAQLNAAQLLGLGTVNDQYARHALAQTAALE